jgi:hypothetical protein
MSASHAPALDAIAMQLVVALDRYEHDVGRMVDTWLDMDLYRDVSAQIEQIRMYCAALPQLSVHWVELLIAHAELVHSLWRLRFLEDAGDRARLAMVRERHSGSIAVLRSRCLRLLSRTE